jgi:hypothetical protein
MTYRFLIAIIISAGLFCISCAREVPDYSLPADYDIKDLSVFSYSGITNIGSAPTIGKTEKDALCDSHPISTNSWK